MHRKNRLNSLPDRSSDRASGCHGLPTRTTMRRFAYLDIEAAATRTAACLFLLACLVAVRAAASETAAGGELSFDESIRPIFTKHCTACHGGVKQAADLSFVYGDSAKYTIEPGESYLIERVERRRKSTGCLPPSMGQGSPRMRSGCCGVGSPRGANGERSGPTASPNVTSSPPFRSRIGPSSQSTRS